MNLSLYLSCIGFCLLLAFSEQHLLSQASHIDASPDAAAHTAATVLFF